MAMRDYKFSPHKAAIFLILSLILLTAIVLSIAFGRDRDAAMGDLRSPEPLTVSAQPIHVQQSFTYEAKYSGIVTAAQRSNLAFELTGVIDLINVDIGDQVQKDTTLARLDDRVLLAQEAIIRARISEAATSAHLAQQSLGRLEQLAKKDFVSRQRLDEARASHESALARRKSLQAELAALQVQIHKSELRAAFDGKITARYLDPGATVEPALPIIEVTNFAAPEIHIALPKPIIEGFAPGDKSSFIIGEKTVEAVFKAEAAALVPQTQTVTAIFTIATEFVDISRPGMIATLSLEQETSGQGSWLPLTALREDRRGLWQIYLMQAVETQSDEIDLYQFEPVPVQILHSDIDRVYVKGDLRQGDLVALGGLHRVTPQMQVQFEVLDHAR